MYVDHDRRALFIHIPKTAGTAIKRLFNFEKIGNRHDTLKDLPNPEEYRDYFIFTIVREPHARLISLYRFEYLHAVRWSKKQLREKYGNDDFRQTPLRSFFDFVSRWKEPFPILQADHIKHPGLDVTVYHQERIHKAFIELRSCFGLDAEKLPKDRETHYLGPYRKSEWSDELGLDYISEHCIEDFNRFGYKPRDV